MFHSRSVYASNFCLRIYSEKVPLKLSAEATQSILESLWKLYVDKQLASAEANNRNALESTRAKASQLQQTYNKTITEAQSNIPDFKTVWNEFKKQKMLQQSQSTQQNAAEESRRRKLESEEEERRRLHEVVPDPVKNHRKAILHEIRPGSFLMGDAQVPTEITKPFAMMDIQFTQMMWARLMIAMGERDLDKINPSKFKTGAESVTVMIEGIEVEMKPNHPVEWVSWHEVKEFIDRLNDLSKNGDAKIQALLQELFPGHQRGDHYDFPTEAQWEFVMRDRGNANGKHFDRDDEADVSNHAWFSGNSKSEEYPDGSTHAVATLKPRIIDVNGDGIRRPFYDLEGNVREWMTDWYGRTLTGGQDPQGAAPDSFRVIRGGSWNYSAQYLRSGDRDCNLPGLGYNYVGFRLVRTRP